MLELICNSAWLLTGGLLAWRLMLAQKKNSPVAVRVVALLCLVLILFPVMSLSDALRAPDAAIGDMSQTDQGSSAPSWDSSGSIAIVHAAPAIRLQFLHFADEAQHDIAHTDAYLLSSDALRAPPAAL